MPDTIPASHIIAKNTLHSTAPWAWLVEVDLDGVTAFRAAGYDTAITWGGNTYASFPIGVGGITRDSDGNLPQQSVVVSNVTRQMATYLESGGVLDRSCQLRRVLTTDLTTSQDWGLYVILGASVSLQVATFALGVQGLFDAEVPPVRFARGRCPYVYAGTECQYSTALPNMISGSYPSFSPTACDLTIEGSNGCRAHGLNEAANGRPNRHPERFGGCPSTPRGPARV